MNVDQGTLSLSATSISSWFIVTYAYICFSVRSMVGPPRHFTATECSPTTLLTRILSFGMTFDARLFSAQERSTSELLRTL